MYDVIILWAKETNKIPWNISRTKAKTVDEEHLWTALDHHQELFKHFDKNEKW